jgi:HEXXH motif-containing protein
MELHQIFDFQIDPQISEWEARQFRQGVRKRLASLLGESLDQSVIEQTPAHPEEEAWMVYRGLTRPCEESIRRQRLSRAKLLLEIPAQQGIQFYQEANGEDWAPFSLEEQNQEILMDTQTHPRMQLSSKFHKHGEKITREALRAIDVIWPELSIQLQHLVSKIVWFSSPHFWSSTAPYAHGAIFINIQPNWSVPHLIDTLAHESGHLSLMIKQTIDPMLENPQHRSNSPLRKDARPMIGIWHATYVLHRICKALSLYIHSSHAFPDKESAERLLKDYEVRKTAGLHVVEKQAVLTAAGQRMFESMRKAS